jgi:hypothetical protein
VLSVGATMFALDFAGSGQSEGDWVTLGEYEKDDVAAVCACECGRRIHVFAHAVSHVMCVRVVCVCVCVCVRAVCPSCCAW